MIFVYALTFGLFVALFTREVIAPASGASCDKRWRIYAAAINAGNLAIVLGAGLFFPDLIRQWSLFTLAGEIHVVLESLIVFFPASFVFYWWHRLQHRSDFLWRTTHQLHHSPSRLETLTAFYAHPLDGFAAIMINTVMAFGVFGVSVYGAALAILYVTVFNLLVHTDMKTPWWLGFIIQRPEMRRLHHEFDSHSGNYGLPIYDLMFGTWKNPRPNAPLAPCGFREENQYRVKEMLLMKDVGG